MELLVMFNFNPTVTVEVNIFPGGQETPRGNRGRAQERDDSSERTQPQFGADAERSVVQR